MLLSERSRFAVIAGFCGLFTAAIGFIAQPDGGSGGEGDGTGIVTEGVGVPPLGSDTVPPFGVTVNVCVDVTVRGWVCQLLTPIAHPCAPTNCPPITVVNDRVDDCWVGGTAFSTATGSTGICFMKYFTIGNPRIPTLCNLHCGNRTTVDDHCVAGGPPCTSPQ